VVVDTVDSTVSLLIPEMDIRKRWLIGKEITEQKYPKRDYIIRASLISFNLIGSD
jgi:hypothetical protein